MGLTRVAGLIVLAAAWPCGVSAQSAVRSATLFADLNTDDGSAIVRVEIDFATFDTADLRIELLGFGNTRTEGFLAGGEDGPLVRFEDRSGRRAWIVVGRDGFEQIGIQRVAETDAVWRFSATYVVHNTGVVTGETVRVHVPVLTVAFPPQSDAGNIFHAEVRVPSYWSVTEAFPTGLRQRTDGVFAVDLTASPSVISLRARTDGAWRPGVPLLLDVLAGAIPLVFVVVGWRHLRAGASAGDPDGVTFGPDSRSPAIPGDRG
jgi:hypothetical protein